MITKDEATALAWLLHRLRPEWPAPSTIATIGKHATEHTLPGLAPAAVNAALTPEIQTPGGIFLPGAHWPKTATERPAEPVCADPGHAGNVPARLCAECWAEIKTGRREPDQLGKAPQAKPQTTPTALNANLRG